jgi:probable F420-dependent oxidoreductase
MRFGIHTPLPGQSDLTTAAYAKTAEDLGFDYVASGEHILFKTPTPSAFVSLAVSAAVTTRIEVLTSIVLLPLYPAAIVAKMAAVLDQESGGRLNLGVGVGGDYPEEFEACGVPMKERGKRMDEALEVVRSLWSGEPLTFRGAYNRLTDVTLDPVPLRRPGVPIWVAGRKEVAMRRAGRFAEYWFPYMYTPEMLSDSLVTVHAAAVDAGRPPDAVTGAIFLYATTYPDAEKSRRVAADTVGGIYQQDFTRLADRYLLHGTPGHCRKRLAEFRDAGAEAAVFLVACPAEDMPAMLTRVAEEILPELRS